MSRDNVRTIIENAEDEKASDLSGLLAVPFSDDALALRFADTYADELRYVAAWSKWFLFKGGVWRRDETLTAFSLARKICRKAAAEKNNPSATTLGSARAVAAVITLAKADPRLAARVDQWDTNLWLLNTPGGVVDLKTGKLYEHEATDYMTKLAGVEPDAKCPIPNWRKFLDRITAGDEKLIAYLRRVAGYSLTGVTREHAMFFFYGTGANGKTTFINAIAAAAGDYHRAAPIETFTDSRNERHPTDLAGLRGARLVTAVETEEGRRWAENKIKQLTGGDKIAARFMRQDFFEFTPQFKLLIAGNHKPGLRSVDEAIRRRFNLIPFTVTIPKKERDDKLSDKLKVELPGILHWMIQGCVEWQEQGLAAPEVVTKATADYLEAEDAVGAWIEECCERDPEAWEPSAALFESWKDWAEKAGEYVGSQRRLSDRLEARGMTPHRMHHGRGFHGLHLLRDRY